MDLYALISLYKLYRPQLKASSADQLRYSVRAFAKHLGRTPTVADFSETTFLNCLASRLGQVSPRTVRRERGDILTLWHFAWRRKLTSEDPRDAEVPRVAIPYDPPIALTLEQVAAILDSCRFERAMIRGTAIPKAAWWRAVILCLYWSGARISALISVQQADLDRTTGWMRLVSADAKTAFGQLVQLPQEALETIHAMGWNGEPIFPWPYQHRQLFAALKRIVGRAGLPTDRYHAFHALRRTTATLAAANGSLDLARQALGHTRESMTRRYIDPRFCGHSLVGVLPRVV